MIKLNINIDPELILSDRKAKYDQDVSNSLHEIAELVPNHKSDNFKESLWKLFKQTIWEQQHHKCAFCEKEIMAVGESQLEHFRPKTEATDENNKNKSRESYWWLAYEHKNYVVSCPTCNSLKGNRFPLEDAKIRVKATNMDGIVQLTNDGMLGDENPHLINPRYQDPAPYLAYSYTPEPKMVHVKPSENNIIGEKTINVVDLNRERPNKKELRDFLPYKRGDHLAKYIKEIKDFREQRAKLNVFNEHLAISPDNLNLQVEVEKQEAALMKKRDIITKLFFSRRVPFSGMCLYWLEHYDVDIKADFIEEAA